MDDLMTLDDLPLGHGPSSLRFKYPSLPPPLSLGGVHHQPAFALIPQTLKDICDISHLLPQNFLSTHSLDQPTRVSVDSHTS